MSVLFADDFSGYGYNSALLLNGLWGRVQGDIVDDPDPSATGRVVSLGNYNDWMRRPFAVGSISTIGVAFRLWLTTLPGFGIPVMAMLDGGNTLLCGVTVTPTGVIQVFRGINGHGGTLLGQTTAPVLTANAYHHIETKFVMDAGAGGSVEVRVDGVAVLVIAGVNTGAATAEQVLMNCTDYYSFTAAVQMRFKDFVVWSGSGTHNNNFLGTVSVVSMVPDGDVSLGWTPSTGTTGWNLLNASPPDDTKYISAPYPPPAPSTFSLTDLPVNVTSVRALISQVRARKSDGGDGNIQSTMISSTDHVDGADRPITTAFTYYEDVFETDPHTAAPWTPASADASQLKINRTL